MQSKDKKELTVQEITNFLSEEVGMYFTHWNGQIINTQKIWETFLNKKQLKDNAITSSN